MTRKLVSEMTPKELKEYRAYMREAKRRSRANNPPVKDERTYAEREGRAEYMRAYRAKKKKKKK